MNRPNSCWLDLAFLWSYCVLQFTCDRFRFMRLVCVIVYFCVCAFVVLDLVPLVLCQYAKRLTTKNVSEMIYVVSSGM